MVHKYQKTGQGPQELRFHGPQISENWPMTTRATASWSVNIRKLTKDHMSYGSIVRKYQKSDQGPQELRFHGP